MFILKNGEKIEYETLEELLNYKDDKYFAYDVFFNEFPIDKNDLSKLYMLFARGGYFEEGYGFEESITRVFENAILENFDSYIFNYVHIKYVKKDNKFYFQNYISTYPDITYQGVLPRIKNKYECIMKSIEMIKPLLEFVKDYDLIQCTFDKEVVKKFKKKFGRKNYHLD